MILFHPQWLEMNTGTISNSLPQDPSRAEPATGGCVIFGSAAILPTETVKERNARDLLTCTDLAYVLVRNNIFLPFLLPLRHC